MGQKLRAVPFGFDFWYLLPAGFVLATIAMSAGVSGSNFWIPIFSIGLGLPPRLGFSAALLTMLFGFGSDVIRNVRAGTVDWTLVGRYLGVASPFVVAGTLVVGWLPVEWMLRAFAVFLFFYGGHIAIAPMLPRAQPDGGGSDHGALAGPGALRPFWLHAIVGGLLQGAIATGSGAMVMPVMLEEEVEHHAVSVGSTVVVVFGLSFVALLFRFDSGLIEALHEDSATLASMMAFALPGAVIGGQLGPRVATRIPREWVRPCAGLVLALVGVLVAVRAFG